jgi:alanyl-tRNA synthetase
MKTAEVREKYLRFMESKGHTVVPSSSIIPENDPTTLFTGSGMQPMIQYLLGAKHPQGTRITDSQKCFRADDIEEVGDNRHTTFFEMLGNWSFGDYFKEEQIRWIWEFLIDELKLNPDKLYITCFGGDEDAGVPKDETAPKLWQELFAGVGIEAGIAEIGSEEDGSKRGVREGERIFYYNSKKNWWSRAGVPENMPAGEPGGPDSEMFYEFTDIEHDPKWGEYCHPNCDCGRFLEIGNNVFMQYKKLEDGSFVELDNKNIDFGGGLERLTAATNNDADIFNIDIFAEIITRLEQLSGKSYADERYTASFRIIADHVRAAEMMIDEGVLPSNTEQGYFVRRLVRRAVRHGDKLGIKGGISLNTEVTAEEEKFRKTLETGLREFKKVKSRGVTNISGHDAFVLFTTYGFPIELTEELAEEYGLNIDLKEFEQEMQKHREESRAGAEQKFKGGLADHSEITTAYHTATHLMLAGLRKYLGEHVTQKGSNITSERARFDFTHGEKVSREILDKVEEYVNDAVANGIPIVVEEMSKDEAKASGATGAFWEKYPDTVTIYNIIGGDGIEYSRELCGGPHVANTADLAKFGKFKIKKESSSSAGVRRVKAVFV